MENQIVPPETSSKIQKIWNVVKTIIGFIIGLVCGSGTETITTLFN